VEASTWIGAVAVATVLALTVGLPPAWRARRLRIVDALAGHR
jgi:ABC-type antimicrobial peptide transport system permease subunit